MEHNEQFPTPLFMATNRLCAVTNLLKQRPRPDPDGAWMTGAWYMPDYKEITPGLTPSGRNSYHKCATTPFNLAPRLGRFFYLQSMVKFGKFIQPTKRRISWQNDFQNFFQ